MKYTFKRRAKRSLIKIYQAFGVDKLLMEAGLFDNRIDKAIEKLGKNTKLTRQELKSDIKRCYRKYLTTPEEYFLFGFEGKDDKYRASFLSDNFRIRTLISVTGEKKFIEDLTDKFNFYKLTKRFFGREAFVIGKGEDSNAEGFCEFTKSHKSLFVKPLSASYGLGAHVLNIESNTDVKSLYNSYINRGGMDFGGQNYSVKGNGSLE